MARPSIGLALIAGLYQLGDWPGRPLQTGAEEVSSRAGGLACIVSLTDDCHSIGDGAARPTVIERTPGYARAILDSTESDAGDILIIVSADDLNSATIDSAMHARELGTTASASRRLRTGADSHRVTRAAVSAGRTGAASSQLSAFLNAYSMNSIILEAIAELAPSGIEPPVWRSSSSPGGYRRVSS